MDIFSSGRQQKSVPGGTVIPGTSGSMPCKLCSQIKDRLGEYSIIQRNYDMVLFGNMLELVEKGTQKNLTFK
jgi:hypothetical protein